MTIGKVVGNLISIIKIPSHYGKKLMMIRGVDESGAERGPVLLAMDNSCAGIGDYVLYTAEGGSAKMIIGNDVYTDAAILGILDQLPAISEAEVHSSFHI